MDTSWTNIVNLCLSIKFYSYWDIKRLIFTPPHREKLHLTWIVNIHFYTFLQKFFFITILQKIDWHYMNKSCSIMSKQDVLFILWYKKTYNYTSTWELLPLTLLWKYWFFCSDFDRIVLFIDISQEIGGHIMNKYC